MDKNREIICLRMCDSDERGYFFSLPGAELYNYLDENKQLDMIYEGFNPTIVGSNVFFQSHLDGVVMQFLERNSYKQTLHLKAYAETDNGNKYVFVLNVKQNRLNSAIEFFDGFYDLDYSVDDYDLPSDMNFAPFAFKNIYGNVIEDFDKQIEADNVELLVDTFTEKIRGVVTKYDVMYNDLHGILLESNQHILSILEKENVKNFDELPFKSFYYNNGIYLETKETENQSYYNQCKKIITSIRQLESQVTVDMINNYLYKQFYGFLQVQEDVKNKRSYIDELRKNAQSIQDRITEYKDNQYKLLLKQNKPKNYKYYASMCLLIKNENSYLAEWLDNYNNIGIDHFYIYDNGSTISIQSTIDKIKGGYYKDKCTVIDFSGKYKHTQYECYNHCLKNFGKDNYWMGFVDTDEFVMLKDGMTIQEFLHMFEGNACVWIPWKVYNSNGHVNKPNGLMTENYTNEIINPTGLYGKVFVQPFRIQKMYVHLAYGRYSRLDMPVNQTGETHCNSFNKISTAYLRGDQDLYPYAWCSHYITRSFQEWLEKIKRGSCDPNFRRKFNLYFDYNPELSYLKNDPNVIKMLDMVQGYT